MYKNKSYKPQLRIGLSRNDKPGAKSPIRITAIPGVKTRTLGISKRYKTSKHIGKLVKSPILINAITNSLPDDIKNSTRKTRNSEAKTMQIPEKQVFREDNNKNENDSFEGIHNKIPGPWEQTVTYSPAEIRSNNYRSKRNMVPVEENETIQNVYNSPNNMQNEDTSISYSPLEIPKSTLNKILDVNKTFEVERLIIGSPKNTAKTAEGKLSNSSLLKMRKCSRLSLKRSSTMELSDETDDDVKPFKKKAKLIRFPSNTSYTSNMSDCSVILDRLSQEVVKTNKENDSDQSHKEFSKREDTVVQFIDVSNRSQEEIDRKSLCNDIISLEQLLKSKINHLDSIKRSIIYKNKHCVQDLTAVTEIWKSGCKLALKDLLISQLNVTMSDLLLQLNIPESIFKYDAETEEVI